MFVLAVFENCKLLEYLQGVADEVCGHSQICDMQPIGSEALRLDPRELQQWIDPVALVTNTSQHVHVGQRLRPPSSSRAHLANLRDS